MERPPETHRLARGSLTELKIVEAGLCVLARDGLAGVTMRTVAKQLGTAPMSLYRHVANRDDLIRRMGHYVMTPPEGVPDLRALDGRWQDVLRMLLLGAWFQMASHRGAVALFSSANFCSPLALDSVGRALMCLRSAGLGKDEAARVAAVLWQHVVGSVLAQHSGVAAWPGSELEDDVREAWTAEMEAAAQRRAPAVAEALPQWLALRHQEAFLVGLDLLIAGIGATANP